MKPNREMPDWKISNSISHVDAFCRFRFFPPEALPSRLSSSAIPTTHAIVAANTEHRTNLCRQDCNTVRSKMALVLLCNLQYLIWKFTSTGKTLNVSVRLRFRQQTITWLMTGLIKRQLNAYMTDWSAILYWTWLCIDNIQQTECRI